MSFAHALEDKVELFPFKKLLLNPILTGAF